MKSCSSIFDDNHPRLKKNKEWPPLSILAQLHLNPCLKRRRAHQAPHSVCFCSLPGLLKRHRFFHFVLFHYHRTVTLRLSVGHSHMLRQGAITEIRLFYIKFFFSKCNSILSSGSYGSGWTYLPKNMLDISYHNDLDGSASFINTSKPCYY